MATSTDPANEIAEFCKGLVKSSTKSTDQHLADVFGVPAWSREYLDILSSFLDRSELLIRVFDELPIDASQREEYKAHVKALQALCSKDVLIHRWDEAGKGGLRLAKSGHVDAISALSPIVRQHTKYPKLDKAETAQVLAQADDLISWLEEHQLSDQDFIRHALIVGLKTFRLRLSRVGWLGWDCAYEGLRDVVAAYMALERGFTEPNQNPNAAAVLKKTGEFLTAVWTKVGHASDGLDRLDVPVRLYALYSAARDTGIAGLLTTGS